MNLNRQQAIIRRWWPLLVGCTLIAGAAASLFTGMMAKAYEARATLVVGQSLSAVNPDYTQLLASQRLSETYATVATTRPILDRVSRELGWGSADQLTKQIRVDAPTDSTLLTIAAQDADPVRAAALANALAGQLVAATPDLQGRQADIVRSVDADLEATQSQITSSQAEVDRLTQLPTLTAAQATRLETLQSRLIGLRSTYTSLLPFSSGNATNQLTIVEPAVAPTAPISPRPLLNLQLGMLAGFLLALGIVFLAEFVNAKVRDPDDAQQLLGLATLGSVCKMKGDGGQGEMYRLAALLYPRSAATEAYRTLRVNVDFSSVDAPIKTLLVTSSLPGEGKTVTASNLAVVFAQAGRRVLLLDADLRKPGVHEIFGIPNTYGVTTVLRSDGATIEAFVGSAVDEERLKILPSGAVPPNPAELLGSRRFRDLLTRLGGEFDIVILDSPPLHLLADTAILSALVDATVLVIDSQRTKRSAVQQGYEVLERANARVLGVVLNRTRDEGAPRPYGDYATDDGVGTGDGSPIEVSQKGALAATAGPTSGRRPPRSSPHEARLTKAGRRPGPPISDH